MAIEYLMKNMNDMKFPQTEKQIFKESLKILARYWWTLLGLAILYYLYPYLILKFIKIDSKYSLKILSTYHVLICPMIGLIIMHLIDCYNKSKLPTDFKKIILDTKRCYIRIFLVYLVADLAKRHLGFGATLIIFVVLYIKLPFLEQEIFFKDSSLWKAIKQTNELTNRPDVMRIITVLAMVFLAIYLGIDKTERLIKASSLDYKQTLSLIMDVLELSFFLFCKAVLTKVYTNIK